jgi:hypothetical protein
LPVDSCDSFWGQATSSMTVSHHRITTRSYPRAKRWGN